MPRNLQRRKPNISMEVYKMEVKKLDEMNLSEVEQRIADLDTEVAKMETAEDVEKATEEKAQTR